MANNRNTDDELGPVAKALACIGITILVFLFGAMGTFGMVGITPELVHVDSGKVKAELTEDPIFLILFFCLGFLGFIVFVCLCGCCCCIDIFRKTPPAKTLKAREEDHVPLMTV